MTQVRGGVLLAVVLVVGCIGVASAAGTTSLELSPATDEVTVNETTTVDIVVGSADGGVGSMDVQVSLSNSAVASITDVTVAGNPELESINDQDGGVRIAANGMDTSDIGEVTIATLTIQGNEAGETAIEIAENAIGDESGEGYEIDGTTSGQLTVNSASNEDKGPAVTGLEFDIDSSTVPPGMSTSGTATATFEDGSTVDVTPGALFQVQNTTVAMIDGAIITGQTPGTTTITATYSTYGGTVRATETLTVEAASDTDITVQNVTVAEPVIAGVEESVTATITNNGEQPIDRTAELLVDQNRTAATTNLDLEPGEDTTISLTYTPTVAETVQRELTVTGGSVEQTTAVDVDIRVITYANDADIVDTSGLRRSIDDWRADLIESDLLREVIDAWRDGEAVITEES